MANVSIDELRKARLTVGDLGQSPSRRGEPDAGQHGHPHALRRPPPVRAAGPAPCWPAPPRPLIHDPILTTGTNAPPGQARRQALAGSVWNCCTQPARRTGATPTGDPCGACDPGGGARPNRVAAVAFLRDTQVQASVVLRGAEALVGVSRSNPRAAAGSGCMASLPAAPEIRLAGGAGSAREADCRGASSAAGDRPGARNPAARNPAARNPAARSAISRCLGLLRAAGIVPLPGRARPPRAARFAARANAIAAFHGAVASTSARAASRSASRNRCATPACSATPRPVPEFRPKRAAPFLTLYVIVAWRVANATSDGWTGAANSAGPTANRAAISGGKYTRNSVAPHSSRDRSISALTYRCCARCGAPAAAYIPCVVFAAIIRAIPSAVRGPVQRPPCIRHRPFAIAGARQGQQVVRARAPQRGARFGLPRGLPFRSGPVPPPGRAAGAPGGGLGLPSMFALTPPLPSPSHTLPALRGRAAKRTDAARGARRVRASHPNHRPPHVA